MQKKTLFIPLFISSFEPYFASEQKM